MWKEIYLPIKLCGFKQTSMLTYFFRYVFLLSGCKSWGWEGLWGNYSPASALMSISPQWLIFQTTCWGLQPWSSLSSFIPALFFIFQFRNFCATTLGQYFSAHLLQTWKKNCSLFFFCFLNTWRFYQIFTPLSILEVFSGWNSSCQPWPEYSAFCKCCRQKNHFVFAQNWNCSSLVCHGCW